MGNLDFQGSDSPNRSAKLLKVLAELVSELVAHGLLEDLSKTVS